MGLAWQQGPFGPRPAGRFLIENPLPEHVLYAEPAGRRMHVELAGAVVAASEDVTLLHETGRYPVAYFPAADVEHDLLRPSARRTRHDELGETSWWSVEIDDRLFPDVAWSHPSPPAHATSMAGLIAFAWPDMDAFYEEDEPISGHAADPYHRVDIRSSRRRLIVSVNGRVIAETSSPLAVFETGFATRWYVPWADVADSALERCDAETLCPYKGVAFYFDVVAGEHRVPAAAWCYPEALPESERLADYVSFDPGRTHVLLDGIPVTESAYQDVRPAGTDRDLSSPRADRKDRVIGHSPARLPSIQVNPRREWTMTDPATTGKSDTQTIAIAAPPDKVLEFVADGANLPRWAIGFAASVRSDSDGGWVVTTGNGNDVPVRIRTDRDAGTIDFQMTPAPQVSTCAYTRVVPNGSGAEYLFTQLQPPGMADDMFDSLVDAVRHELTTLKAVLEVACPS